MPTRREFDDRVNSLFVRSKLVAALGAMLDEEVEHFAEYLGAEFDSPKTDAEDRQTFFNDLASVREDVIKTGEALIKMMQGLSGQSVADILRRAKDEAKRM